MELKLGRIFTVFAHDCRFGLPLTKPFVLHVAGSPAAVILLREFAPLEFVDPTNSLEAALGPDSIRPFRTTKPLAIPDTRDVFLQAITVMPKDTKLDSPEVMREAIADASFLAIFSPLGDAVSLRSRFSTEIAIAVECSEGEWRALPKGKLDDRHVEVWDEFVRTYHMVTADVRPAFWDDSHRLVVVKQGWVPYETAAEHLDPSARLGTPISGVPIDRHQVMSSYNQDGKFSFDRIAADEVMRRYFAGKRPVPLGRETLSGAQRAVELFRTGKTAVIECTIAIEVAVEEVVTAEKLKRGVSKTKLDEYKNEVGLGYQLNVDLPMILAPLTDSERTILGAADAVRKRRNEIVHRGAQPDREEGQRAVGTVRSLLDLLRARGYHV